MSSCQCRTSNCPNPAVDEYHWFHGRIEVVWLLCGKCLTFAEEVIECVSNLDDEREREKW